MVDRGGGKGFFLGGEEGFLGGEEGFLCQKIQKGRLLSQRNSVSFEAFLCFCKIKGAGIIGIFVIASSVINTKSGIFSVQ